MRGSAARSKTAVQKKLSDFFLTWDDRIENCGK